VLLIAEAALRIIGERLHRPIFFGFGQVRLLILLVVVAVAVVVALRSRR